MARLRELGKLSLENLNSLILDRIKKELGFDSSILLPPAYGEDGAVIKLDSNMIVAVADPITGASELAGWLSVIVNSNDIAVHMAEPKWFLSILLFPPGIDEVSVRNTVDGIIEGCKEVGCKVIGGHTEITDRVTDLVISGFMLGVPLLEGVYISSGGAREGDAIIMTKGAGIEGTFIICSEFSEFVSKVFGSEFLRRCAEYKRRISVLPEVKLLKKFASQVHAMHDATEGGLLGGVFEIAKASNLGFRVNVGDVGVTEETRMLADVLSFDPLKMISSGTLIISADESVAEEITRELEHAGIRAFIIGKFVKDEHSLIYPNGKSIRIYEPPQDELWSVIKRLSSLSDASLKKVG